MRSAEEEARIREEIRRTRARMTGTVQSIQDKLSLDRFVKPALKNIGQAIAGGSATWVQTVRQNPVPLSILGASLGWLMLRSRAPARPGIEEGKSAEPPIPHRSETKSAARTVRELMEERPLVLGAACVAVGLAVGLALPATRTEAALAEKAAPAVEGMDPPEAAPV